MNASWSAEPYGNGPERISAATLLQALVSLIDQLLAQVQHKDAASILGSSGLASQLTKRLAQRMPVAELSHHMNTEAMQGKSGNHRNGSSRKTVTTPEGLASELIIPFDRQATFEP